LASLLAAPSATASSVKDVSDDTILKHLSASFSSDFRSQLESWISATGVDVVQDAIDEHYVTAGYRSSADFLTSVSSIVDATFFKFSNILLGVVDSLQQSDLATTDKSARAIPLYPAETPDFSRLVVEPRYPAFTRPIDVERTFITRPGFRTNVPLEDFDTTYLDFHAALKPAFDAITPEEDFMDKHWVFFQSAEEGYMACYPGTAYYRPDQHYMPDFRFRLWYRALYGNANVVILLDASTSLTDAERVSAQLAAGVLLRSLSLRTHVAVVRVSDAASVLADTGPKLDQLSLVNESTLLDFINATGADCADADVSCPEEVFIDSGHLATGKHGTALLREAVGTVITHFEAEAVDPIVRCNDDLLAGVVGPETCRQATGPAFPTVTLTSPLLLSALPEAMCGAQDAGAPLLSDPPTIFYLVTPRMAPVIPGTDPVFLPAAALRHNLVIVQTLSSTSHTFFTPLLPGAVEVDPALASFCSAFEQCSVVPIAAAQEQPPLRSTLERYHSPPSAHVGSREESDPVVADVSAYLDHADIGLLRTALEAALAPLRASPGTVTISSPYIDIYNGTAIFTLAAPVYALAPDAQGRRRYLGAALIDCTAAQLIYAARASSSSVMMLFAPDGLGLRHPSFFGNTVLSSGMGGLHHIANLERGITGNGTIIELILGPALTELTGSVQTVYRLPRAQEVQHMFATMETLSTISSADVAVDNASVTLSLFLWVRLPSVANVILAVVVPISDLLSTAVSADNPPAFTRPQWLHTSLLRDWTDAGDAEEVPSGLTEYTTGDGVRRVVSLAFSTACSIPESFARVTHADGSYRSVQHFQLPDADREDLTDEYLHYESFYSDQTFADWFHRYLADPAGVPNTYGLRPDAVPALAVLASAEQTFADRYEGNATLVIGHYPSGSYRVYPATTVPHGYDFRTRSPASSSFQYPVSGATAAGYEDLLRAQVDIVLDTPLLSFPNPPTTPDALSLASPVVAPLWTAPALDKTLDDVPDDFVPGRELWGLAILYLNHSVVAGFIQGWIDALPAVLGADVFALTPDFDTPIVMNVHGLLTFHPSYAQGPGMFDTEAAGHPTTFFIGQLEPEIAYVLLTNGVIEKNQQEFIPYGASCWYYLLSADVLDWDGPRFLQLPKLGRGRLLVAPIAGTSSITIITSGFHIYESFVHIRRAVPLPKCISTNSPDILSSTLSPPDYERFTAPAVSSTDAKTTPCPLHSSEALFIASFNASPAFLDSFAVIVFCIGTCTVVTLLSFLNHRQLSLFPPATSKERKSDLAQFEPSRHRRRLARRLRPAAKATAPATAYE
jgi:hypothetical protein